MTIIQYITISLMIIVMGAWSVMLCFMSHRQRQYEKELRNNETKINNELQTSTVIKKRTGTGG